MSKREVPYPGLNTGEMIVWRKKYLLGYFNEKPNYGTIRKHKIIVEINIHEWNKEKTSVDLLPISHFFSLSVTGEVFANSFHWICGGQISETLLEWIQNDSSEVEWILPKYQICTFCHIWERWHLNEMRAGTRLQEEMLKTVPEMKTYEERLSALSVFGCLYDRGYKYGHSWLVEPLPEEVVEDIKTWLNQEV